MQHSKTLLKNPYICISYIDIHIFKKPYICIYKHRSTYVYIYLCIYKYIYTHICRHYNAFVSKARLLLYSPQSLEYLMRTLCTVQEEIHDDEQLSQHTRFIKKSSRIKTYPTFCPACT